MNFSRVAYYGILSILALAPWTAARADESPAQNRVIVNDPDERISSVPTNSWTFSHQSPQDLSNTISARNARIVDIAVEQVAPSLTFTVTYVENTGQYYKGWWWCFGLDGATLDRAVTTNKARLISLKA